MREECLQTLLMRHFNQTRVILSATLRSAMERTFLVLFIILGCITSFYNGHVLKADEESSLFENKNAPLHRNKRSVATDESMDKMSPSDRPNCKPGAPTPNIQVNTTERLQALRSLFSQEGIEAYLIPSEDAHQSEYTSKYDGRREYISGCSGSYGYAVVFADKAAFWTDGRYYLQAEDQLDCNWILMKRGLTGVPTLEEYVISVLRTSTNKRLGASPFLLSSSTWLWRNESLASGGVTFKEIHNELIDQIWTNGRPAQPKTVINALPMQFSGRSWQHKIVDMHAAMDRAKVDAMIISGLDETAWLFNLRASDIPYNPFFISYAIVERANNRTRLYLVDHLRKLTERPNDEMTNVTVSQHLNTGSSGFCTANNGFCVEVKKYNNTELLNDIDEVVAATSKKIWISYSCNYAIYSRITPEDKIHQRNTPAAIQKAKKNPVEIQGMKNAHIKDAVALIKFVAKLEKEVKEGKRWTEVSAAEDLKQHKGRQKHNRGLSFASISSSGPNGAVIHYVPTPATDRDITTNEMYLLDSGGQYLDGTTDVTRTFHFGTPSDFEKECYTRVLMGHIDLAEVRWPNYLYGRSLDVLARRNLWKVGLRYRHGTGHGIGAYLSVHEGPGYISVSSGSFDRDSRLSEGQFFSDEPGYYEDGKFGIRHETIIMVKKSENLKYSFPSTTILEFEPVALVPFEPNLIQYDLLTDDQIAWLNMYNNKIMKTIGPLLKDDDRAYKWLQHRVQTITKTAINEGYHTLPNLITVVFIVSVTLMLIF